jgi:hypothetical protein
MGAPRVRHFIMHVRRAGQRIAPPLNRTVRRLVNPYQEIEKRVRDATSLEELAAVLEILLSGEFAVWTDGQLYSIKQLVARIKGLKVEIFPREHAPPHFHVSAGDINATFAIDDGRLLSGDIDGRSLRLVQWWYERGKPLLIDTWNRTRPDDCPVGAMRTS